MVARQSKAVGLIFMVAFTLLSVTWGPKQIRVIPDYIRELAIGNSERMSGVGEFRIGYFGILDRNRRFPDPVRSILRRELAVP